MTAYQSGTIPKDRRRCFRAYLFSSLQFFAAPFCGLTDLYYFTLVSTFAFRGLNLSVYLLGWIYAWRELGLLGRFTSCWALFSCMLWRSVCSVENGLR